MAIELSDLSRPGSEEVAGGCSSAIDPQPEEQDLSDLSDPSDFPTGSYPGFTDPPEVGGKCYRGQICQVYRASVLWTGPIPYQLQ